jgi:hypothetical protein
MPIQSVTSKIISTLGNKESLVPIMLKDGVDSASLTYKSFKEGGAIEGKDRAIDEFGTQAIWIGGIPLFKKIIDKTIYKAAKLNPDVDPRIIANKEYSTWAVENAKGIMTNSKTQTVQQAITDCLKDGGNKAKNLFKGKVVAATALTLGTYFFLTKMKHKKTKNSVLKNMQQTINDTFTYNVEKKPDIFAKFSYVNSNNDPSFKGMGKNLTEAVMFNPVHNMKIIDAGITTERLACSRNTTEFAEHAIKEGGFLFFLYGFGNLIEKGINKLSKNVLNKPIDLPIDVLTDKNLSKALTDGSVIKDVNAMSKCTSLTDKLNFIKNNPDNILVQAAKKSKLVSVIKEKSGKSVIDTSKYIDMKDVSALGNNLKTISEKFAVSGQSADKFLNTSKYLKVGSVLANIGISCLFLGYIIPKAVYKYRQHKTGTTKFHVEQDIKNGKN